MKKLQNNIIFNFFILLFLNALTGCTLVSSKSPKIDPIVIQGDDGERTITTAPMDTSTSLPPTKTLIPTATNLPTRISTQNVNQLEVIDEWQSPSGRLSTIVLSPDQRNIAAAVGPNIYILDSKNLKPVDRLLSANGYYVSTIKFSPDGKYLASFNDMGATVEKMSELILYDVETRHKIGELPTELEEATWWGGLDFSKDSSLLVSHGMSRTLRSMFIEVWDIKSQTLLSKLFSTSEGCTGLVIVNDKNQIVCGNNSELLIFSGSKWLEKNTLTLPNRSRIRIIMANPDDNFITIYTDKSGAPDTNVFLLNTETWEITHLGPQNPPQHMFSVNSPDKSVFINFERSLFEVFDANSKVLLRSIVIPDNIIKNIIFSDDQSYFLVSTNKGIIQKYGLR